MLANESDDVVLYNLVEIAILCIHEDKEIANNVLEAPVFWTRHFVRLVNNVLNEEKALQAAQENILAQLTGNHLF